MAQHQDIAVCAHVCCWAILRYYSATLSPHREYLLHEITKLVAPFDPGGLLPSLGLDVLQAERVFQAAGCFPLLVARSKASSDEALVDERFLSQLTAYLESGFPLFVAIRSRAHAVVIVGYNWKKLPVSPQTSPSHIWTQIDTLLTVDDNSLPYATVPLRTDPGVARLPSYGADLFTSFIVALPEKLYYPADAIEDLCRSVKKALDISRRPDQQPLELQRYFITTVSKFREYAREHQSLLAWIIREDGDSGGDTGASVWYKRCVDKRLATTETPA